MMRPAFHQRIVDFVAYGEGFAIEETYAYFESDGETGEPQEKYERYLLGQSPNREPTLFATEEEVVRYVLGRMCWDKTETMHSRCSRLWGAEIERFQNFLALRMAEIGPNTTQWMEQEK